MEENKLFFYDWKILYCSRKFMGSIFFGSLCISFDRSVDSGCFVSLVSLLCSNICFVVFSSWNLCITNLLQRVINRESCSFFKSLSHFDVFMKVRSSDMYDMYGG